MVAQQYRRQTTDIEHETQALGANAVGMGCVTRVINSSQQNAWCSSSLRAFTSRTSSTVRNARQSDVFIKVSISTLVAPSIG